MSTEINRRVIREMIAHRTTGYRTIGGTNWTVSDCLVREKIPGHSMRWILTTGICNGTADKAQEFKTGREARAVWNTYAEEP